jgi:hypothetical protein
MKMEIITETLAANPTLPGFESESAVVTEVGIMFGETPPTDSEIEDIMLKAVRIRNSANWVIGDAINYLSTLPGGEQYTRWSEITGLEVSTLQNIATVARKVGLANRKAVLKFEHHKAVAALPSHDQDMWLNTAIKNKLSRDKLRKSILLGRVATDDDMLKPVGGGIDTAGAHVARLMAFERKLGEDGWFEWAPPHNLYALHRDMMPAIKFHTRILKAIANAGDLTMASEVSRQLTEFTEAIDSLK